MERKWLALTVEYQLVAQEVLGLAAGRCLEIFYSENSVVISHDSDWVHGALNVLIGLFRRYGLVSNFTKYKAMACHPVTLRSGMTE